MTNLTEISKGFTRPNPEVVDALQHMMQLAIDGVLQSVACAGICRDGSLTTNYSIAAGHRWALVGGTERLKQRVMDDLG